MFQRRIIPFIGGEWRRETSDNLLDFFSAEKLRLVFPNIEPDHLKIVIDDCKDIISCYYLYKRELCKGTFACIIEEDADKRILSIHGGGVSSSFGDNLLLFRAYIAIVSAILDDGYTLQTSCSNSNIRAIKFNYGVGFTPIAKKNKRVYMQVNLSQLHQSVIYRYLNSERSTHSEL